MQTSNRQRPGARAPALVAAVATLVLAACGSSGSGCFGPGPCAGDFPTEPVLPTVDRPRVTTQVGGTAVFSVHIEGIAAPTVQWLRAPAAGGFSVISGAVGTTYSLQGASALDNGARFQATVSGGFDGRQVSLASTPATLAVVSLPPVVLADTTFAPGDWSVAEIASPANAGPTHAEQQVHGGGNPGDYRSTTITLPAGIGTLTEFDEYQGAAYDPATQGAIFAVDFSQDCLALPGTLSGGPTLLLTQDGRRYTAGGPMPCGTGAWSSSASTAATFLATEFVLVDGPACAAGTSCPDFTATGLPIRFGFANSNQGLVGFAGGTGGFGIDNWKVAVWRR